MSRKNYETTIARLKRGPGAPEGLPSAAAPAPCARLSNRERAVLDLLERGLPNKLIGYRLGLSQSTVKAHVHNIIVKLNVHNRTEAAVAHFSRLAPAAASASPSLTSSIGGA